MLKNLKKADLQGYARKLLLTNVFIKEEQRSYWLDMIGGMKVRDLNKLVGILEDSKNVFRQLLKSALKEDKKGILVNKLEKYMRNARKEMAEVTHKEEEFEAENFLTNNLKNI